ncbi:unnamed protein product [Caenorhabditis auriculariae]|uniref:Uncharacterized protein n=1 Tax=Caenorhabditis auriculariae TaxID=2777116 RepID=A0A8S1GQ37_9PELO|nr:unnamed protein product [Caenorhabditis auriculariae]
MDQSLSRKDEKSYHDLFFVSSHPNAVPTLYTCAGQWMSANAANITPVSAVTRDSRDVTLHGVCTFLEYKYVASDEPTVEFARFNLTDELGDSMGETVFVTALLPTSLPPFEMRIQLDSEITVSEKKIVPPPTQYPIYMVDSIPYSEIYGVIAVLDEVEVMKIIRNKDGETSYRDVTLANFDGATKTARLHGPHARLVGCKDVNFVVHLNGVKTFIENSKVRIETTNETEVVVYRHLRLAKELLCSKARNTRRNGNNTYRDQH